MCAQHQPPQQCHAPARSDLQRCEPSGHRDDQFWMENKSRSGHRICQRQVQQVLCMCLLRLLQGGWRAHWCCHLCELKHTCLCSSSRSSVLSIHAVRGVLGSQVRMAAPSSTLGTPSMMNSHCQPAESNMLRTYSVLKGSALHDVGATRACALALKEECQRQYRTCT